MKSLNFEQGQLMHMTMMVTPSFNKELHNLNKEDRLQRWLVGKHKDTKYELKFVSGDDGKSDLNKLPRSIYHDNDNEEYKVEEEGAK